MELNAKILDVGRDLLQSFAPLQGVHEHVCGFHFYAHDVTRQVEAHHYCSHPTEEMRQCIIFGNRAILGSQHAARQQHCLLLITTYRHTV